MDLGYIKIKIDIRSEYNEYKKKYSYKRKELKKQEIKKIFESFKEFFKSDGHFKFKENEHSIVAEYRDYGVKLEMDIYKNVDSEDFDLCGTIETFDKQTFEFIVSGVSNKECALQPAFAEDDERMVHDTRYFKDFLEEDTTYSFEYKIKSREEVYENMLQLLLAL